MLLIQIAVLVDFVIVNWLTQAFVNWLNKLLVDYSNLLQIWMKSFERNPLMHQNLSHYLFDEITNCQWLSMLPSIPLLNSTPTLITWFISCKIINGTFWPHFLHLNYLVKSQKFLTRNWVTLFLFPLSQSLFPKSFEIRNEDLSPK